jgi:hypothetical protein
VVGWDVSQIFIMKKIFRHGFRGGWYQFFGVKLLNRVGIRNFMNVTVTFMKISYKNSRVNIVTPWT